MVERVTADDALLALALRDEFDVKDAGSRFPQFLEARFFPLVDFPEP